MQNKEKSHILLVILILGVIFISPNVYAGSCPLGPDVTRDLYGALKIIRIVAPLLVIAYSTLDTVKALTKGDGGSELKKVAQRFGKRAIYAVILFFLPMIIDLFMQMADVWDANGDCMQEIENPGVTSGNPTITTEADRCAAISDQRSCDGTGGCNWQYGMCRKVGINGATTRSPQQQCQDSGKTWDATNQMCIDSGSYAFCARFDRNPPECQNNGCAFNMSTGDCSPK